MKKTKRRANVGKEAGDMDVYRLVIGANRSDFHIPITLQIVNETERRGWGFALHFLDPPSVPSDAIARERTGHET